ncbi:melanoma-associated antigen D2-like isoform X1 [Teleopsis dalmanni]|uniref:melanoma-associated antigen D2-like isoform X1 n=1 Tax=Teleopsis dalmanni TaxID=139649 RepID=UPI0018CD2691|nr:melanoma-associated antigen D2-like isoform X1 [Teleopsis dalmanni]XP_037950581.1 melanoma-associated antigen D2-like isoform X1 [Teleopsis dalmanni]XP_037950582.1 melanoma-associated antigen D2-like isoform X1 [Teleopsis dalmanni]
MEELSQRNIANCLIQFILNNAASKIPIKASDMAQIANVPSKSLAVPLEHVGEILKKNFGIILQVVPNVSPKRYICISELCGVTPLQLDEKQKREQILLFIILAYIFMIQSPLQEERLEKFLYTLDINVNENHPFFGNVKKLITDTFIKQLYLKREKRHSDVDAETQFIYSWGYRSTVEYTKMDILNATANIMGKSPDFFIDQYKEAQRTENPENVDQ